MSKDSRMVREIEIEIDREGERERYRKRETGRKKGERGNVLHDFASNNSKHTPVPDLDLPTLPLSLR